MGFISSIYRSEEHGLREIHTSLKPDRKTYKRRGFVEKLKRRIASQKGKEAFALHMAQHPTSLEAMLDFHLRAVIKDRLEIQKQALLYGYIADFYIPRYGLVFEADGRHHESDYQQRYDARRDTVLAERGIETHRFVKDEFYPAKELRRRIRRILNTARLRFLDQHR